MFNFDFHQFSQLIGDLDREYTSMKHLEFGVGTRVYTSDKQFDKLNN